MYVFQERRAMAPLPNFPCVSILDSEIVEMSADIKQKTHPL